MLDLGIVSRFCEMIGRMCERGNVRKSSTINTDFLADAIHVDVLIKIITLTSLEKNLLRETEPFSMLKCYNAFLSAVEKNYDERRCLILWTCLFIKFCWCCFSWMPFVSTKHTLSGYLFCGCCKPKWGCRNIPWETFGAVLPVSGAILVRAIWGCYCAAAAFQQHLDPLWASWLGLPSILILALKCFLDLPTFALLSAW